jgi:hypothetical protein
MAADRRAAVLAGVDQIERESLRAVLDFDSTYPHELRGDAGRFASFRARCLGSDPTSVAAIYRGVIAGMNDLHDALSRIACPTLVIAGSLDRTRPPQMVEPIARAIAGARFEVFKPVTMRLCRIRNISPKLLTSSSIHRVPEARSLVSATMLAAQIAMLLRRDLRLQAVLKTASTRAFSHFQPPASPNGGLSA